MMIATLTADELDEYAGQAAGNWKDPNFYWRVQPDDAGNWCHYTVWTGEEVLLDVSNGHAIRRHVLDADPDQHDHTNERHSHWACGYVEKVCVRVYDDAGAITPAFRALCECIEALGSDPVLDYGDLSDREWDAALDVLIGFTDVPAMYAPSVLDVIAQDYGANPDDWPNGTVTRAAARVGLKLRRDWY